MEIGETKEFLKRIKSHYQEFIIDDFKFNEWYKELKKYDYQEVNKKLDEHLNSETYGEQIPKLHFLTKYLTPISEKGKIYHNTVICQLCGQAVLDDEYENHYGRCSAICYIERQAKKYYNKALENKAQLYELSSEEFNKKYDQFLLGLLNKGITDFERKLILKALYPQKSELELKEILETICGREER